MMDLPATIAFDQANARLSLDPRDPSFVQDPYPAYAALHAASGDDGPIFHWQDYGHSIFGGLDAVNALFRDKRLGRQNLNPATTPSHLQDFAAIEARSLLELEPPNHTRLRAAINKAFVPRRIEAMRAELTSNARERITDLGKRAHFDVIKNLAEPFAGGTILQLIGIDRAHTEQLIDWSHAMVAMYQAQTSQAEEHAANAAARAFAGFVQEAIHALRSSTLSSDQAPPLLKFLIDETDLDEAELISTTVLLLNAGHEATVHAMGHGVHQLLNCDSQTRIRWLADSEALVEEVLRHRPPLHMFTRYVKEDCTLYGVPLKRGDVAGLHLGLANRDPRAMPHPDVFDPTRDRVKQVAFGAGIHFCIGHMLARLEMEIALPMLFEQMPNVKLTEAPSLKDAYHFHGLNHLMVQTGAIA